MSITIKPLMNEKKRSRFTQLDCLMEVIYFHEPMTETRAIQAANFSTKHGNEIFKIARRYGLICPSKTTTRLKGPVVLTARGLRFVHLVCELRELLNDEKTEETS